MSNSTMAACVGWWASAVICAGVLACTPAIHAQNVPAQAAIVLAASIEGVSPTSASSASLLSDRMFTPASSSPREFSQLTSVATALAGMLAALFVAAAFAFLVVPRAKNVGRVP